MFTYYGFAGERWCRRQAQGPTSPSSLLLGVAEPLVEPGLHQPLYLKAFVPKVIVYHHMKLKQPHCHSLGKDLLRLHSCASL